MGVKEDWYRKEATPGAYADGYKGAFGTRLIIPPEGSERREELKKLIAEKITEGFDDANINIAYNILEALEEFADG